MKKLLLLLLLIIVSQSFIAQNGITSRNRKEIFLKSQMSLTGIKSVPTYYSVIGIKEATWQYAILEFRCPGQFSITISQEENNLFTQSISFPDNKLRIINIPLTDYLRGYYTMTIININTGESVSGNFIIQ